MQMVLVVAALAIISTITNDDLEQEDFDDWLTLVAHSTSVETIRREDVYLIKKYFTFQKLKIIMMMMAKVQNVLNPMETSASKLEADGWNK